MPDVSAPACREEGCEAAPTVEVFGPHGALNYCTEHGAMYAGIMRHLGIQTRTRQLAPSEN